MSNKVYRFPVEEKSVGGFYTKLTFKKWAQKGAPKTEGESLGGDFQFHVWLPYPLQLGTAYAGNYEEKESMYHTDRGNIEQTGFNFQQRLSAAGRGVANEMAEMGASLSAPNASSAMSQKSIINNNMGLLYKGTQLRSHSFSWRLAAKSSEEQEDILSIIAAIKYASLPTKDQLTFDHKANNELIKTTTDLISAMKKSDAEAAEEKDATQNGNAAGIAEKEAILQSARDRSKINNPAEGITTLGIPDTVSVEFYMMNENNSYIENPSLFRIGDSFITNFEINYTSQGNWQAHYDGSPMETQITMSLKEIRSITSNELEAGM